MSKGLFDARRKIASVASMLRQDKVANAAQTLYSGLQDMLREPLLKSERDEFTQLIGAAVRELNSNKKIRAQFSITVTYTPGQESALLEEIKLLMDTLDAIALDEADKLFREREAQKKARLEQALAQLEAGQAEAAKKTCAALCQDFADDVSLLVEMSEAFEKYGMLEEAVTYMEKAYKLDPGAAYILNKLGILYRKAKRFEDSEKMFSQALGLTPDDPFIYFNKGRLYVDWQKWKQAKEAGENALLLQPGFVEAQKLADYAAKRL